MTLSMKYEHCENMSPILSQDVFTEQDCTTASYIVRC